MSGKAWFDSYKPSLSTGVYGGYTYSTPIEFYPKTMDEYLALKWEPNNRNNEYYIRNKFEKVMYIILNVACKYINNYTYSDIGAY